MAVYQAETIIHGAPDRIFPWLTEPDRVKQWIGGLVESIPLDDGRLAIGARAREVVEESGRRFTMESEVVGLEPDRLLAVNLTSAMADMASSYRLTPAGATTRVHHTMEARYKGVMKLFAPLIRRAVQRKLEGDLTRLKQAVEKAPKPLD
jgi:uncharacterized protein YndB with AHSA1/START domain